MSPKLSLIITFALNKLKPLYMASIYYSLSAKKNTHNQSEILIRFTHGRINQRAKSNLFIEEEHWDSKLQQVLIPKFRILSPDKKVLKNYLANLGEKLSELSSLIQKSFNRLDKKAVPKDWLKLLIDKYNFPEKYLSATEINKSKSFFELYDEFLEKRKLSKVREKNYMVLKRALKRFELFISFTEDKEFSLNINTLNCDIITDLESFLANEHSLYDEYNDIYKKLPSYIGGSRKMKKPQPRGINTINALFNKLRAFTNWCLDNNITTNKPFKNYESKPDIYGTPYYITIEERNQLLDTNLNKRPQLAIQRDIFVFQCLIGCRVSDLYKMTSKNIIKEAIEYIPRKTKEGRPLTVRVPLNSTAKKILKKYECTNDGKLFPFISKQKYNDAIKEMFLEAGLTRSVTVLNPVTNEPEIKALNEVASSHLARRTFVGNLYKQVKDPNLVGSLSGHKEGSKAFSRYRDIDEDMKIDLVNLLE